MTQPCQFFQPAAIIAVVAALALAGCDQNGTSAESDTAAQPTASAPPGLPAPLIPEAEEGERGARNVLLGFARALENKQFGAAWALLGPTARGGRSEAQFAAEWADLSAISVAVLDGDIEGAAGSLFYSSRATITALDGDGRPVRFEGPIVLRRVNDVPGATEAQLRWHIETLDLVWTH